MASQAARVAPSIYTLASNTVDRQTVLELLAYKALTATVADGAAIALGSDESVVCTAMVGQAPPIGAEVRRTGSGLTAYCLRTGETLVCADTWTDGRCDMNVARQQETHSVAIVPVFALPRDRESDAQSRQLLGLVEVFARRSGAFEARCLDQLHAVSGTLVDFLEPKVPTVTPDVVTLVEAPAVTSSIALVSPVVDTAEPAESAATADPPFADAPLFEFEENRTSMWGTIVAIIALIAILVFISWFPSR